MCTHLDQHLHFWQSRNSHPADFPITSPAYLSDIDFAPRITAGHVTSCRCIWWNASNLLTYIRPATADDFQSCVCTWASNHISSQVRSRDQQTWQSSRHWSLLFIWYQLHHKDNFRSNDVSLWHLADCVRSTDLYKASHYWRAIVMLLHLGQHLQFWQGQIKRTMSCRLGDLPNCWSLLFIWHRLHRKDNFGSSGVSLQHQADHVNVRSTISYQARSQAFRYWSSCIDPPTLPTFI
jgi:hypothetical protein